MKLTIARIGDSAGLVSPREALRRLNAAKGDTVFLSEGPDGVRIAPRDPDFERQTALLGRVAKERRSALRKLATGAAGWRRLSDAAPIAAPERQLVEHGGAPPPRDAGAPPNGFASTRRSDELRPADRLSGRRGPPFPSRLSRCRLRRRAGQRGRDKGDER